MSIEGRQKNRIIFTLTGAQMKLIDQLVNLEKRKTDNLPDLWCKDVVCQYLHEFRVMPQAWGKSRAKRTK